MTVVYAIVLAGGYAKRLWPLTIGVPKALLPIAGKPVLEYIVEKLEGLHPPLNKIVLSTNMLFQPQFEGWLTMRGRGNIEFYPDASSCEVRKPGAVQAMANIILTHPDDDVLVIAGDGMFNDDLSGLLRTFKKKQESVVAIYDVDSLDTAKRCATVSLDNYSRIMRFAEKPTQPTTKTVCGAVYLFKKGINRQFKEYLSLLLPMDQPGLFVEWLYRHKPVYGYKLKDPLWDIGTPESYKACDAYFGNYLTNGMVEV